jgi:trimethylamine--corrinoid protein Co-methyltransferase
MRSEYFSGNGVTDSKIRAKWKQNGSLDARERAQNIARQILALEEQPHISPDIDRRIRDKFTILI